MNKVLGKGLSALIPEKIQDENADEDVRHIDISLIDNNRLQPRLNYNVEKLNELKASIKEKGVLQPILVRNIGDRFEVVAGERRLRASRELKLNKIPAVVKALSDQEALVIALIENIQREELNPIEEAEAFQRLITEFEYTQESVAQSVGKDRTTITNLLRVLKLPQGIKNLVASGSISVGHARALLSAPSESEQTELARQAVEKNLSVRALESLVKNYKPKPEGGKQPAKAKDQGLLRVEDGLKQLLGTKVMIDPKKKGGRITIEFYSPEDLNRIVKLIIK